MIDDAKLKEVKRIKEYIKNQTKGKGFNQLNTKDKDMILEAIAKMFGLID